MIMDILKLAIGPIIKPLIDRIPNKNEARKAEEEITKQLVDAANDAVQGQLAINAKEAQHGSIFVAGWRPGIGWICGFALGWNFILHPILMWFAFITGVEGLDKAPTLDTGELSTILLGMLGLGGLRTYEKRFGVARAGLVKK